MTQKEYKVYRVDDLIDALQEIKKDFQPTESSPVLKVVCPWRGATVKVVTWNGKYCHVDIRENEDDDESPDCEKTLKQVRNMVKKYWGFGVRDTADKEENSHE